MSMDSLAKNAFLCCFWSLAISLSWPLWLLVIRSWHEIWCDALLLLEERGSLPFVLCKLCCSFISQLVVDFYLVPGHFDVLFDNADLFLFLGSLESEIILVLVSADTTRNSCGFARGAHWLPWCNLLFFFKPPVEHLICLKINLVLLVKLHLEADHVCN